MTLLRGAWGTTRAPPLKTVPAGAVVIDGVWQISRPSLVKALGPAGAGAMPAASRSRGGTFVDRRKRTKASSWVPLGASAVAGSLGSGATSKAVTGLPFDVFSLGNRGLVIPISLRKASAEKETRLACWFFQPKRPMRITPGASSTGTWMMAPAIAGG